MKTLKNKLIPNFLKEYIIYYQENGFKKTIQKFGIKLIATIIVFYLIFIFEYIYGLLPL